MNLEYEIPGVKALVDTVQAQGVRLADSFFNDITSDTIGDFDCLLGSDIIGVLKPLKTVDLGMGTAFETQDGLILFGDVDSYFSSNSHEKEGGHGEGSPGHDDRDDTTKSADRNEQDSDDSQRESETF